MMYRDLARSLDAVACTELDDAMRGFGQSWVTDETDICPDDLLTVTEIAAVADVSPAAVRMWVHRGRLQRCAIGRDGLNLYRWGDVVAAQIR